MIEFILYLWVIVIVPYGIGIFIYYMWMEYLQGQLRHVQRPLNPLTRYLNRRDLNKAQPITPQDLMDPGWDNIPPMRNPWAVFSEYMNAIDEGRKVQMDVDLAGDWRLRCMELEEIEEHEAKEKCTYCRRNPITNRRHLLCDRCKLE